MRAALLVALAACKGGSPPTPQGFDAAPPIDASRVPPDAAPRSHVAWLLDAFEAERDAEVRERLAIEIAREDAVAGGVTSRTVALVNAYRVIPGGEGVASDLLMALVKGEDAPPRAVGDLVLELAEHGGDHTRFVAFHGLRKMRDRLPEVCAVLARLAPSTDLLPDVLSVAAVDTNPCAGDLQPFVDAMARAMRAEDYDVGHYLNSRVFVQNLALTQEQLDLLYEAARVARNEANRHLRPFAERLVRQIDRKRD